MKLTIFQVSNVKQMYLLRRAHWVTILKHFILCSVQTAITYLNITNQKISLTGALPGSKKQVFELRYIIFAFNPLKTELHLRDI
jgi:hypothetical protein